MHPNLDFHRLWKETFAAKERFYYSHPDWILLDNGRHYEGATGSVAPLKTDAAPSNERAASTPMWIEHLYFHFHTHELIVLLQPDPDHLILLPELLQPDGTLHVEFPIEPDVALQRMYAYESPEYLYLRYPDLNDLLNEMLYGPYDPTDRSHALYDPIKDPNLDITRGVERYEEDNLPSMGYPKDLSDDPTDDHPDPDEIA